MYAGSTLVFLKQFDAWFGAHQKIDRVARNNLVCLLHPKGFPTAAQIIKFEGLDGPDGIKRKTPAQDEPWHFYNPRDPKDTKIITIIEDHRLELIKALKSHNQTRASFEAAWLAHAIVDGLTPAHHYPYEEELKKLRGGASLETRTSAKEKIVIPGETLHAQLGNNWRMWGEKGLLATHLAFEWGVAIMAIPLRLKESVPTPAQIARLESEGLTTIFKETAAEIAELNIYSKFYQTGWTPRLGKVVRKELMPRIICAVTLAWYDASCQAKLASVKQ